MTLSRHSRIARFSVLSVLAILCTIGGFAAVQDRQAPVAQSSELGRENLSRVAASAADIKAVLLKDTGLLVELKRWVAKDATGHGQIISDADLTDDAMFDRLETDVEFRSVATLLVQKYGYLVPKLNPESQAAKEHELLVQERVKWLAQTQEEELAAARQKSRGYIRNTATCDPQSESDCTLSGAPEGEQIPGQPRQQEIRPSTPGELNVPNAPHGNLGGVQRTQLMQTEGDFDQALGQLPLGGSDEVIQSVNATNAGTGDLSALHGSSGTDGTGGDFLPVSNPENRTAVDTFAAYGVGTARPNAIQGSASAQEALRSSRRDVTPAVPAGSTSLNTMQPMGRGYQPKPQPPAPELVRARSPYNDIPSLYDMYVQAVPRPALPKRFGAEVFENGTRDSQVIPMDLPAGPEYVVGPGDGLSIDLYGGSAQRLYRIVDREGRISLPEVGPLLVSGKSLADVQQSVQLLLRTEFRRVSADVSLARLRTIRVYEVGDVASPGAYDVSSLSTPLNALFVAGGRRPKHRRRAQDALCC